MSNGVKSMLTVSEFANLRLKKFNVFEREGKKPLYFVEFVDADSFESTGEMMLLKPDFSQNDAFALSKLEKQKVSATIKISAYNGRSSVACIDIKQA